MGHIIQNQEKWFEHGAAADQIDDIFVKTN